VVQRVRLAMKLEPNITTTRPGARFVMLQSKTNYASLLPFYFGGDYDDQEYFD
jgi:hypothetical protein